MRSSETDSFLRLSIKKSSVRIKILANTPELKIWEKSYYKRIFFSNFQKIWGVVRRVRHFINSNRMPYFSKKKSLKCLKMVKN